jgi:ribosome-binding protein aMBF1 (putative translation factor)
METALSADTIRCVRCGQPKPPDAYARSPGKRNGRHSWCKPCLNDYSRGVRRSRGQQPAVRRVRVRTGWIRCSACGTDFPESEFRRDRRGQPYSYCRECHNAYISELNRAKRKDPAYRAKLRKGERTRRRAEKREVRADRAHRLQASQQAIGRLRENGWSLRRIATESGLHRTTLSRIVAGRCVPYQETYRRLRAFARGQQP